ncbi:retrovirus-related pol polyprotein from transposon TNT 1-94 [Tanacetum coccineum]
MNGMNSRVKNVNANVSNIANKKKRKPKVLKPKKVWSKERLASPKPRKPRTCLRWSPTGRIFDLKGKIIESSESESQSDYSNGDNACTSNPQEPTRKQFPNSTFSLAAHSNLFLVPRLGMLKAHDRKSEASHKFLLEFCDSDLEVAFRRNTCFIRNLEGVDLLKGNCTINLYTINLHEMASTSPICLMARATSTKKKASQPPKPVPNSKQRLHLLHMDLCGPIRVESIKGKRYVQVIVDDYSRYTWVYFLRSKDEATEEIKTFLKKIIVLLQASVIIVRTDNGTKFKNQVLKEYFDSVGISHQASSVITPQPNGVVERRSHTLVGAARTMLIFSRAPLFLWAEAVATVCYTQNRSIIHYRFNKTPYELINGRKLDISFLHVFRVLCYPKNDREDIGKLGEKAMYDDYIGGQLSAAIRTAMAAQVPQVLQTLTTSTTIADTAPTPTNLSSQATNIPNTSQDVDELEPQQQYVLQQDNQAPLQPKIVVDNVSNDMLDGNMFVNPFDPPTTSAAESSSS